MPKASINEYGNFLFPEDDVRPSVQVGNWLFVKSVLHQMRIECFAQGDFRRRSFSSHGFHTVMGCGGRWFRIGRSFAHEYDY